MSIALRPRSLGEILDAAIRLLREDFGLYALTAILCLAPVTFLSVFTLTGGDSILLLVLIVIAMPFALVGVGISWPGLCHQMDTRLQGGEPDLASGLRRGLRLLLRVLAVSILAYLLLGVAGFVAVVVSAVVGGVLAAISPLLALIIGIPLILAAIAAVLILIGSRLFLILPVIVVEDARTFESFRRASKLTEGARVPVAALFLVTSILIFLPTIAISALTGTLGQSLSPESATLTLPLGTAVLQQGLNLLITGVTTPFMIAVMTLAYYDRRIRAEGYDLESAAEDLLG